MFTLETRNYYTTLIKKRKKKICTINSTLPDFNLSTSNIKIEDVSADILIRHPYFSRFSSSFAFRNT